MPTIRSDPETLGLTEAAQGLRPSHLAVIRATLVDVYTGEVLPDQALCVWDRWIAYVGPDPGPRIGSETRVLDAGGKVLIPGLIDAHAHVAWLTTPEALVPEAIRHGTTTIITEIMEPYPVAGLAGVLDFLDALADQPVRFLATAPAMVSISPAFSGIAREDLRTLLGREEILALGESYWQAVLQGPETYLPLFQETLRAGKVLEGHTAGASEAKLAAYAAFGISSCHEPITPEEVLARLRWGIWCMIREGGVRKDLAALAPLKDQGLDLRRVILVSDGVEPGELLHKGYMDHVLQKAIDGGLDPVKAIQMVTLNPAEHFRLDHLLGGLAPGRYADFLIIPGLHEVHPEVVACEGRLLYNEGHLVARARPHNFGKECLRSVKLPRPFEAEDFRISPPSRAEAFRVRVIDMVSPLVTREIIMECRVAGGEIPADPDADLIKVAAVDRTHRPGRCFTGLLRGFGLRHGALACSAAWDTSDIIVAGCSGEDMAGAVNRVEQLQGGAVLWEDGHVVEELPLPIFGLMSDLPLSQALQALREVQKEAARRGVRHPDPILSLMTLTGAAIPFLRICEEGLFSLREGRFVQLFVSS